MSSHKTNKGGGIDRREVLRFPVLIDIEWEGDDGRKPGTLSDLSTQGCFVLCDGNVEDGTVVTLFIPLSNGEFAEFLATAASHLFEAGFAARFIGLTELQTEFLQDLIDHHAA
jgi:hypothetical protein